MAKEELRALCALASRDADPTEIRQRLWAFYAWCADAHIPELTTLAETIETWWPVVLVFLQTRLTNARTQATIRLIKQAKRTACGFRNRDDYRRRVRRGPLPGPHRQRSPRSWPHSATSAITALRLLALRSSPPPAFRS
jgi:hypothetical protein